ncbi:MAG: thymidine phosphorylase [Gammaproteobacteria bacterium]|nr:thymidine phosphorylase [Gammaproteobacteria bacterium]
MLFVDVIRKKRDGHELSQEEIQYFVNGLSDSSIPAEQVSALAMAIFLNAMTFAEAGMLTRAMAASGTMLDWKDQHLDGPIVDKHSTGGIGDKVSFLLAPIAAACGCYVPMISGRGLGHGGGTLDKIGAIPGYEAIPSAALFKKVVKDVGCAIIGQTRDLAPADRRLYSIRDVTATVESVPLITASILSKKMAAGLDGLVMDIKFGTGAFMSDADEAETLASSIVGTAAASGMKTHALLTDMNENLGRTAGNAVEVRESVQYLAGDFRDARLDEVTLGLVAEMLVVGGIENDRENARKRAEQAVASGRAAEVFAHMVTALGGPADFFDNYDRYLPAAPVVKPVFAEQSGILVAVDGRKFGNAIIELGGGRRKVDDELDLSVGFVDVAPIGTTIDNNTPLALVHAANDETAALASQMLRAACVLGESPPTNRPVIYRILDAD